MANPETTSPTLGFGWQIRYWLARKFISGGIRIMPGCRYKRDLVDRMYELRWHVEDTNRMNRLGGNDAPT